MNGFTSKADATVGRMQNILGASDDEFSFPDMLNENTLNDGGRSLASHNRPAAVAVTVAKPKDRPCVCNHPSMIGFDPGKHVLLNISGHVTVISRSILTDKSRIRTKMDQYVDSASNYKSPCDHKCVVLAFPNRDVTLVPYIIDALNTHSIQGWSMLSDMQRERLQAELEFFDIPIYSTARCVRAMVKSVTVKEHELMESFVNMFALDHELEAAWDEPTLKQYILAEFKQLNVNTRGNNKFQAMCYMYPNMKDSIEKSSAYAPRTSWVTVADIAQDQATERVLKQMEQARLIPNRSGKFSEDIDLELDLSLSSFEEKKQPEPRTPVVSRSPWKFGEELFSKFTNKKTKPVHLDAQPDIEIGIPEGSSTEMEPASLPSVPRLFSRYQKTPVQPGHFLQLSLKRFTEFNLEDLKSAIGKMWSLRNQLLRAWEGRAQLIADRLIDNPMLQDYTISLFKNRHLLSCRFETQRAQTCHDLVTGKAFLRESTYPFPIATQLCRGKHQCPNSPNIDVLVFEVVEQDSDLESE